MVRVAFVADVHLGNHKRFGGEVQTSMNTRCREGVEVFRKACETAEKEEVRCFVVAGDLFDYSRPEAPLVTETQKALGSIACPKFIMRGNHDMVSSSPGDHALGPLEEVRTAAVESPRIEVIYDCNDGRPVELLLVPFQPGHARGWLPGVLKRMVGESAAGGGVSSTRVPVRCLVLHLGIKDSRTPPWLAGASDSIDVELLGPLCDENRIQYVVAGNWHDRREWRLKNEIGTHVVQCGALVPTGFDNPGLDGYGGLVILAPEEDAPIRILEIPGPRFVKVKAQSEVDAAVMTATKRGHRLYASIEAEPEKLEEMSAALAASGIVGEVLPNQAIAVTEAKRAAFAAKSSKTMAEALAAFVRLMHVADGVDRRAVLERAKGYLR